uniref:Uncharacterized protein n=1 Tax=Romanomermis culicivorax TaxID=13658 RepID=A0A915J3S8_ROMCU
MMTLKQKKNEADPLRSVDPCLRHQIWIDDPYADPCLSTTRRLCYLLMEYLAMFHHRQINPNAQEELLGGARAVSPLPNVWLCAIILTRAQQGVRVWNQSVSVL